MLSVLQDSLNVTLTIKNTVSLCGCVSHLDYLEKLTIIMPQAPLFLDSLTQHK